MILTERHARARFRSSSGDPRLWALFVVAACVVAACGSNNDGNPTGGTGGATAGSGGRGSPPPGTGGSGTGGSGSGGAGPGTGGMGVAGQGTGGRGSGGSGTGGRGAGGTTASGGSGTGGRGVGGRGGTGAGGPGTGGTAPGTGGRVGTLRIMPLGDSTTASICYRSYLWQMLTAAGHTQFDFIGTRHGNPGCTFSAYDQDNEGHAGYIVSDILKAAGTGVRPGGADSSDPYVSDSRDLATWFDGHPADVVIMHFGTNDVWNSAPISTQRLQSILMAYTAILARLRANNPNVRMLVAQITPLAPAGCTACTANARALDDLIPGWAMTNARPESPISVVDQFTGFVPATDTVDGVHSNNTGSMKLALNWFNALAPLF